MRVDMPFFLYLYILPHALMDILGRLKYSPCLARMGSKFFKTMHIIQISYAEDFRNVKSCDIIYYFCPKYRLWTCYPEENIICATVSNSFGDFGAKSTSRIKRTEFSNDYLFSHAYSRKTNPVTRDFLVIYL